MLDLRKMVKINGKFCDENTCTLVLFQLKQAPTQSLRGRSELVGACFSQTVT